MATPMAAFVRGKPIMADHIPDAAYAAGDVIVKGNTPFVAHEDNPMFGTTPVISDALAAEGGIYQMQADGAIGVGQQVYWDATAKKVSLTAGTNTVFGYLVQGPTLIASDPGTANSGDNCLVLHAPTQSAGAPVMKVFSIAVAGSNQATATNTNYGFNLVSGANGVSGVIMPTPQTGRSVWIKNNNNGASPSLIVYPQIGGTINAGSANTQYNMANFTSAVFIATSNTAWHTLPLLAS